MPSPLEQLLGADDLQRLIGQMLLKNPVAEGHVDPTSPYYASGEMLGKRGIANAYGGVLPDRSGDTGMAFKPNRGASQRMAPRDQGLAASQLLSPIADVQGKGGDSAGPYMTHKEFADQVRGLGEVYFPTDDEYAQNFIKNLPSDMEALPGPKKGTTMIRAIKSPLIS